MGHNMSNIKNIVCNVSVSLEISKKKKKNLKSILTMQLSTKIAFELPLFCGSTTFSLKNHDTYKIS